MTIFCQACGAQNSEDAKFCNMCGGRIARSGEPGGPIAGAPPAGDANSSASMSSSSAPLSNANAIGNTTSITLAGIGVLSPTRTYALLGGGALALLALGAGGAWIAMHSGAAATPAAETAEPTAPAPAAPDTTPVEIGDAVPIGADTPDQGVVISGGPRVRRPSSGSAGASGAASSSSSGASAGGASGATGGRTQAGGSTSGATGGGGSAGAGSTGAGSAGAGSTGAASASGASGSTGAAASTGGAATGGTSSGASGSTDSASSGAGSTTGAAGTASSGSRDWGAMADTVTEDEPDLQMDLYATQVRRFIRNYYAQRAAGCFEHESRLTGQTVRGTVVIAFTIASSGHVQGATVSRNTTNNETIATCLQRNVASWELPAPPDGQSIEMEMPFSR